MRIGAIAYQPYVYNTNTLSAASLNRIGAIPNDATAGRTDFEKLTENEENRNPLGKGQSANFMDILSSQMAMSRTKSAMLLKPAVSGEEDAVAGAVQKDETVGRDASRIVSGMQDRQETQQKAFDEALTIGDEESGATGSSMSETKDSMTSYKMRHALDAYSMTMGMIA